MWQSSTDAIIDPMCFVFCYSNIGGGMYKNDVSNRPAALDGRKNIFPLDVIGDTQLNCMRKKPIRVHVTGRVF